MRVKDTGKIFCCFSGSWGETFDLLCQQFLGLGIQSEIFESIDGLHVLFCRPFTQRLKSWVDFVMEILPMVKCNCLAEN